jgi:2-hydroxycyclohexanecarboxyl-CoA dehydrogenase
VTSARPAVVGKLQGRVAIVTGAGQGIGAATSRSLAAEGARVAVSGRTYAKVEQVVAAIVALGGEARAYVCDVTDPAAITVLVASVVDDLGAPDILINTAQGGNDGAHGVTLVEHVTAEAAFDQYTGGPLASLRCMQAVFPHMQSRGGRIVNFGSTTGVIGQRGFLPYSMAKEAIHALTKTAAREWGRYGITVNTVCPAALTPSSEEWAQQEPQKFAAVLAQISLGRLGDLETDIGPAIAMLVSDDMAYLTGATLMLDGGGTLLR